MGQEVKMMSTYPWRGSKKRNGGICFDTEKVLETLTLHTFFPRVMVV